MASESPRPLRQIRALQDSDTITVYQAYNSIIADEAIKSQRLNASPAFRLARMTWIKPSWCWMMYRSGYSYKDANQARILALRMRKDKCLHLLETGVLTKDAAQGEQAVRVQWDPERGSRLEVLPHRSIQIGIPGSMSEVWARGWIEAIEDVTYKARELKRVLDEQADITHAELVTLGLIPDEEPLEVSESIATRLGMD